MKIVITIADDSKIKTEGWSVADAIDHACRNPEDWVLVGGSEALFIEAIEPVRSCAAAGSHAIVTEPPDFAALAADPQPVDWDRIQRLRGIGAHESAWR